MELFYEKLDSVKYQCKTGEVSVVIGDLNVRVGEVSRGIVVGRFGLGERNAKGFK